MPVLKSLLNVSFKNSTAFVFCDYELEKKLHVKVLDVENSRAFCGDIEFAGLQELATRVCMKFDDFISLTEKALFHSNSDSKEFKYVLEEKNDKLIFRWKNVDTDETVVNVGSMQLNAENYSDLLKKFLFSVSENLFCLNKTISKLQKDVSSFEKEKNEALKLLSASTKAKTELEKELYSKFTLVLNEKKMKIRELKQGTYKATGKTKFKNCGSIPKKGKVRHHVISESSSESEGISDKTIEDDIDDPDPLFEFERNRHGEDENSNTFSDSNESVSTINPNPDPTSKNKPNQEQEPENNTFEDKDESSSIDDPGPSKTKHDISLLFFDDDDVSLPVTPTKMRNRNANNSSKRKSSEDLTSNHSKFKPCLLVSDSDDDLINESTKMPTETLTATQLLEDF